MSLKKLHFEYNLCNDAFYAAIHHTRHFCKAHHSQFHGTRVSAIVFASQQFWVPTKERNEKQLQLKWKSPVVVSASSLVRSVPGFEFVPIATHVVRIRNVSKRCVNGKVFLLVTETAQALFRCAVSRDWLVKKFEQKAKQKIVPLPKTIITFLKKLCFTKKIVC